MPIIRLEIFDGRTEEMKRELVRRVSEAASAALDIPLEHVQCIITEVPRRHWSRGGVLFSERVLEGDGYKHTI